MKNYVLGILGACLGGFLFAIPWVLLYVYGEVILSLLAALIAFGALLGYKLCKGEVNNKTPLIITIVSLVVVVVTTLLVIPAWLIAKEGLPINDFTFRLLYNSEGFTSAIMRDLVISVVFTFLGISGVIRKLKQDVGILPQENIRTQSDIDASKEVIPEANIENSIKENHENLVEDTLKKDDSVEENTEDSNSADEEL